MFSIDCLTPFPTQSLFPPMPALLFLPGVWNTWITSQPLVCGSKIGFLVIIASTIKLGELLSLSFLVSPLPSVTVSLDLYLHSPEELSLTQTPPRIQTDRGRSGFVLIFCLMKSRTSLICFILTQICTHSPQITQSHGA